MRKSLQFIVVVLYILSGMSVAAMAMSAQRTLSPAKIDRIDNLSSDMTLLNQVWYCERCSANFRDRDLTFQQLHLAMVIFKDLFQDQV